MGSMPFYQKPSFQTIVLAVVLAGTYVYSLVDGGSLVAILPGIALDLFLLLAISQLCLFFFSQFVVPLRTREQRGKIYQRLLLNARGAHGPAIFVENGRILERRGERPKRGPGLLWVDTASAVVTRSESGASRALGPGVHFTSRDEKVAGTFSLHAQSCSIGPGQEDRVFEKPAEDSAAADSPRFADLQARRLSVTARTRDGNEVVPEIRVVFKLDAAPAQSDVPGSRFGYMREAVERAALGEGVSAGSDAENRYRVAWNQLPSLIAVDLWREYLSKFTLDELFKPIFPALPELLQPQDPAPEIPVSSSAQGEENFAIRFVRRTNDSLVRWLDGRGIGEEAAPEAPFARKPVASSRPAGARNQTALEIVGQMMKERMTQAVVPILDDCGRLVKGHTPSEEFKRLKERGLAVLEVNIDGVRFDPAVEDQIVQHWSTAWLATARNDRRRVEQLELLAVHAGRQRALLEHAAALSEAIHAEDPKSIPSAVRTLLRSTQSDVLMDERLRGRGGNELEALSQILRWAEAGDHE